jgi:DNA topoisomerase-1
MGSKNLVIVESPAKAKTIEQYLGSDFSVKSSFGHIRDLPKKGLNIDIEHGFEPTYDIPDDKKKIVNELKKAASGKEVWLASDEDREGEAIAWHLAEALKLDPKKTKRIVFHEITKPAIENAIKNPRTIDIKLVDAQQARRILDRLVGYELSPVLWKKVRTGLSAGRVQSVAVRLIVEREREIRNFKPAGSFRVTATFTTPKKHKLPAELSVKLADSSGAKMFLESCVKRDFAVISSEKKPATRNPSAPFTTSTLQQEASRRLGYSVRQTMTLAQRLYESGRITYMRTDSTNLSVTAIKNAETYITKNFSKDYWAEKQYKTKSAGAQEAHEAIRPTDFNSAEAGGDDGQKKLYKLIWQRALASQMAPARINRAQIAIAAKPGSEQFLAKGETLVFDGFMKVYGGGKDDVLLPEVAVGDKLTLDGMAATATFTRAPARYSEATLVRKLEELGIGRPSTYAPTIGTIQSRGYVEKSDLDGEQRKVQVFELKSGKVTEKTVDETYGADKGKLLPTDAADVTTDFLMKYFANILDYDFTAKVENGFDDIADGKESWNKMIADFYKGFHPLVEKSEDASREEASQMRKLGTDPKTKRPVFARFGRYGAMLQLGEKDDEEKPQFASLPTDATLETVGLEQALEMFKLPRMVGKTAGGEEITANIGRFGPYIQVGKIYVSLKEADPLKIDEAEARELYEAKLQQEKDKHINEFAGGLKILNGPYGPYITDGKKNAKIEKGTDPKKITEAEAKKMLAQAPAKGKGRRFARKTSRK